MKRTSFLVSLLLTFALVTGCSPTKPEKQIRGAIGRKAMVVSAHPIATDIGIEILRNGGNAIDAAIATQFALAVVYPRAGNIGGGGFSVVRLASGEVHCLDFREKAPALASRDMYLDENGDAIATLSQRGHLAAGVPGSVAGMWQLHQQFGSQPWEDLVAPAIAVADTGFHLTDNEAEALNEKQPDFKAANSYDPWVINNEGWKAGDHLKQPELARTLSLIRTEGKDGFYKGEVAQLIVQEMKNGNGIISLEDLSNYQAVSREPVYGTYKGHKIIGMPPPSSGGVALLQLLQGAEILDLDSYAHNSSEAVHLMAEIEKRVFADRAQFMGDPDHFEVPVSSLISKAYNQLRFDDITIGQVTPSSQISAGHAVPVESEQTTHFSIVDPFGNAIAVTTTLNLNYGCKVWVKGAGFVLNNEMDDFSAKPGVPNYFGLIGAEANAIQPGKRMVSSMTPTIVEKDGQLKMVLGTPGGATIITSVFQTIINVIDHGMTMQEAVNAKKVHHQWLPDEIKIEDAALEPETIRKLEALGHKVVVRDPIGRNDCILVRSDGTLEGGADYSRGDDFASGF